MHFLFDSVNYWTKFIAAFGYFGIFSLMALESSFFPFPSEIVVPPAGYLASRGELNIFAVILVAVFGSWTGAAFNYYISRYLGRTVVLRLGGNFGLTEERLKKLDNFFAKYGDITTLIGRLLPIIRQYISLPAGLAKMNFFKFSVYTCLGASLWVILLAYVGYFVGNNLKLVHNLIKHFYPYLIVFIVIVVAIYFFLKKKFF